MTKKTGIRLSDMTVKVEDCYDPADYVLVHQAYLHGLRSAIRDAHERLRQTTEPCLCLYCSSQTQESKS